MSSKPMKFDGYLIVSLEGQLTPTAAALELIDNVIDANATSANLVITKRSFSIADNGDGTDDPNEIATPSRSRSRHNKNAIGSKAIGAKQACATFGREWTIESCPKNANRYHRYHVSWNSDGPLPNQYEDIGLSRRDAPAEIRNGGTKITVTGRQDGFPRLRLESLCRNLEEKYRPALKSGNLRVTISNPDTGFLYELRNPADDTELFSSSISELSGEVAGRAFLVRYGALKQHDRALSYCHHAYPVDSQGS